MPLFAAHHVFWILCHFKGRFPEASFAKKVLQGSHIHVFLQYPVFPYLHLGGRRCGMETERFVEDYSASVSQHPVEFMNDFLLVGYVMERIEADDSIDLFGFQRETMAVKKPSFPGAGRLIRNRVVFEGRFPKS